MKLTPHVVALSLLTMAASDSQAAIVEGLVRFRQYTTANQFGIVVHLNNTIPVDDPYITFIHEYNKSNSLGSLFKFERVLTNKGMTVPFPAALMLVKKGDVLTDQSVKSGRFPIINGGLGGGRPESTKLPYTVGREFWLAAVARDNSAVTTFKIFSWAKMRFNAFGKLEMIDSITAHDEPGLVVGDKTPCVPCAATVAPL